MLVSTFVAAGRAEATGTLEGRVFAVAAGGDIKPARIAHVFLAAGDDAVTLQESLEGALTKRREDVANNADTEQACLLASMSIFEAVKSDHSIRTSNTDEDGSFDLPKLKAGAYIVVVIGTANGFQSVWYQTAIVTAGKRQKVKLSEPALACQ